MLLTAVPFLGLCAWRGWFSWWHGALGGLIAAILWSAAWAHRLAETSPQYVYAEGPALIGHFLTYGVALGVLLWNVTINESPALAPRQSRRLIVFASLAVLLVASHAYRDSLSTTSFEGRVIAPPKDGIASVKLKDASVVPVHALGKSLPEGRIVWIDARREILSPDKVYVINQCPGRLPYNECR